MNNKVLPSLPYFLISIKGLQLVNGFISIYKAFPRIKNKGVIVNIYLSWN